MRQTITAPGLNLTQDYCYDSLNRLASASENSGANWSQTYGYDRWGNRWVSASPGYGLSSLTPTGPGAFNTANNRLTASGYDAAGNQTADVQGRSFEYDGENRQTKFNTIAGRYFYDGDGRRVKKIDSAGTTVFVYNAGGQLIAEYHSDPVPPAAGGGGTSYLISDHLGSTRVVTKSDGTVKARYDYLPFGEELGSGIGGRTVGMGYSGADSTKQKFTQKERDNESGLDYFGARYYSSAQGRFTGTDPLSGDEVSPQSWNLYTYVQNNPLNAFDPDGKSTHTNKNGVVVAVYEDGNLGVYQHNSLKGWNGKSTLGTEGKGINRMGETEHWDEFRAHDDNTGAILGTVARGARIHFNESWTADIQRLNYMAISTMELPAIAAESRPNESLDIKNNKGLAPEGHYTGKLLNGKYASAKSAGNYLAGLNSATGTFIAAHISLETALKLAGALQQKQWGKANAARILTYGAAFGPPPYYGEIEYSGRRIVEGFTAGQRLRDRGIGPFRPGAGPGRGPGPGHRRRGGIP